MRTIFALIATGWFVVGAILIGDGSVGLSGDPPNQEVIGDPAVIAIHLVARVTFVGLALLALALVEPASIRDFLDQHRIEAERSSG